MDYDDIFIPNSDNHIGQLDLVAGSYDELRIGPIIIRLISKKGPNNLTRGDIVKAMIINGLGYVVPSWL